jgi:transcriptional regulator with XRE-family HTH domain
MRSSLADTLRRAIQESGMSRYAIAEQSGVDEGTLSKFVRGLKTINVETADKLMNLFGLEVRAEQKRGRG